MKGKNEAMGACSAEEVVELFRRMVIEARDEIEETRDADSEGQG